MYKERLKEITHEEHAGGGGEREKKMSKEDKKFSEEERAERIEIVKMKRIPATVRTTLQLMKTGSLETRGETSKRGKKDEREEKKGKCRSCKKEKETPKVVLPKPVLPKCGEAEEY